MNESKEEDPTSNTSSTSTSIPSSWELSLANLSTPLLQSKLEALTNESSQLSTTLTAKLASSPSGQSLLHIGPSLSSLPPDLESLLDALRPFVKDVKEFHGANEKELERIVTFGKRVEKEVRRGVHAKECREWLVELVACEGIVEEHDEDDTSAGTKDVTVGDKVDMMASIERLAYTTLCLLKELEKCSNQVSLSLSKSSRKQQSSQSTATATSISFDNEQTQFWLKLSPRIRQLEKDACRIIQSQFEQMLVARNQRNANKTPSSSPIKSNATSTSTTTSSSSSNTLSTEQELVCLGHLLRSLAYLNKGYEAEQIFSRVAISPILRSKVSLGKIDEGGSRGECAGLFLLLQDVAYGIQQLWGDLIRWSECMFELEEEKEEDMMNTSVGSKRDVYKKRPIDLVTSCWSPIATMFMTDTAIKMALFSPGIGNILQANYKAVDTFLSELASIVLKEPSSSTTPSTNDFAAFGDERALEQLYYQPTISSGTIQNAQYRLYSHTSTIEFSKKWNLPIYYQLRFGEACARLEKALNLVQEKGIHSSIASDDSTSIGNANQHGLELSLFVELYDVLSWMWNHNVFLRPLTNRFLRGATQLLSRFIAFMKDGLDGTILFADPVAARLAMAVRGSSSMGDDTAAAPVSKSALSLKDIATVSWDLSILEQIITSHYQSLIQGVVQSPTEKSNGSDEQLASLISDVLKEATQDITPMIQSVWNETIVRILNTKCSTPLSAVKGVAATYRMTNRPAPTRPSPYVATILKPLKEFYTEYAGKIPSCAGDDWKQTVIASVAMKYSKAVSELLETVQRTEEALKNRKARRTVAGGMSDGEKVKLQLFLDHKEFMASVRDLGIDPFAIEGVAVLKELTSEAENLLRR